MPHLIFLRASTLDDPDLFRACRSWSGAAPRAVLGIRCTPGVPAFPEGRRAG